MWYLDIVRMWRLISTYVSNTTFINAVMVGDSGSKSKARSGGAGARRATQGELGACSQWKAAAGWMQKLVPDLSPNPSVEPLQPQESGKGSRLHDLGR